MRLFPIRPNAFDGAFAGRLESLGDVPCNTLVDILEALGDVADDTLVDTLEPLGDVADDTLVDALGSLGDVAHNTLVYTLGSLGDVACNMLVYIHVYVVLPWVLAIHIPTSPFLLRTAGNYPD